MALCVLSAQAGMLYHLPFQDSTGNATLANYGTVGGTASQTGTVYTNNTPPRVGRAFARHVPGSGSSGNNRIVLPNSNDKLTLQTAGDEITVMAFVRLDAYQTVQGVVSAMQSNMNVGWTFHVRDTGRLTFVLGYGAGNVQRQVAAASALSVGTWHHVAFTFVAGGGNDALKLYINGESVAHAGSSNLGTYVADKNVNVTISVGVRAQYAWDLNGIIDEVRLYDTALTQSQIQEIAFPPTGTVLMIQ